jgi:hypothetical protein
MKWVTVDAIGKGSYYANKRQPLEDLEVDDNGNDRKRGQSTYFVLHFTGDHSCFDCLVGVRMPASPLFHILHRRFSIKR